MTEYIATVVGGNDTTLEVSYEAPGHEPVLVGVLRPLADESFEDLIRAAAPTAVWDIQARAAKPKQQLRLGQRYIHKEVVEAPVAPPVEKPPKVFVL